MSRRCAVLEALPDSQIKLEQSFDIRIQVRSALIQSR